MFTEVCESTDVAGGVVRVCAVKPCELLGEEKGEGRWGRAEEGICGGLRHPGVPFINVWDGGVELGCGEEVRCRDGEELGLVEDLAVVLEFACV